jgi:hypothetical protein
LLINVEIGCMKAAVAPDLSDYAFTLDITQAGTLPARWYTDPVFLTLEDELIFAKIWRPVGRAEMVLRPGDFFTCELAGEPLVITRDGPGHCVVFTMFVAIGSCA